MGNLKLMTVRIDDHLRPIPVALLRYRAVGANNLYETTEWIVLPKKAYLLRSGAHEVGHSPKNLKAPSVICVVVDNLASVRAKSLRTIYPPKTIKIQRTSQAFSVCIHNALSGYIPIVFISPSFPGVLR